MSSSATTTTGTLSLTGQPQIKGLMDYLAEYKNLLNILFVILLIIMIIITLWVIITGGKDDTEKLSARMNATISNNVFLSLFILFIIFGGMFYYLKRNCFLKRNVKPT